MDSEQRKGLGLTFRLEPQLRALIAEVQPEPQAEPIDETWLSNRLFELGHGDLHYLPDAGATLVAQYNSGSRVPGLRIAECVDAAWRISLSADELTAYLDITPARGGASVTEENVLEGLAQVGVSEGIMRDAIERSVADGVAEAIVIARGRAAVAGQDGRFECLVDEARDRAPRVSESGQTDFRDLGEILVVDAGAPLMLRHQPTEGLPGVTVLGKTLPTRRGRMVAFAAGLTGVTCSPDNPDLLVAAVSGQPVQVRSGMIVEPVHTTRSVDMATGNIDFDGSVKVLGDVAAGMTVRASGDIEITGTAEPCRLEAGGSIVIRGGALGSVGRKEVVEHNVQCGASFSAGYAQQLRVEAGDSIFIDDMVMQCELSAANHIRVGNVRRGHIIGGRLRATLSITGKVLGSPNRIATRFEIGIESGLHKRMLELAQERDGQERQLLDVSKLLALASAHPGRLQDDIVERARNTAAKASITIESLREEESTLKHKAALALKSRVVAEQAMHEGVVVRRGNRKYRVLGEHGGCAIVSREDGLELVALSEIDLDA